MSLTNLWRGPKSNRHPFVKVLLVGLLVSIVAPFFSTPAAYAADTATWKSKTEIVYAGNTFTYRGVQVVPFSPDTKTQYQVFTGGDTTCASSIYFPKGANLDTVKTAEYLANLNTGVSLSGAPGASSCAPSGAVTITFSNTRTTADATATPEQTPVSAQQPAGSGGSGIEDNPDACDTTIKNPLTWVLCPVVDVLHKATDVMQAGIVHLMTIDVTGTFDQSTDTGQAYYTAWNSFRVFGIALIIIAGLIMVISQAMGFELFDAYTVKRVLPRLVVAVIGISLSWWLLKFLVVLTNDLGIGIRKLIFLPFEQLAGGQNGMQSWGSSLIGDLVIVGAFVFLQIGGVLSLLATVALAALVAFVVLVLRQIVITFLILIAPLAIACYVLPNTEKAYKLWWDSLFKGLMMFPIISAFLAAGAVFSVVASHNTSGDFDLSKLISILAYFLPYFALPFTFRLAGGAIATLGGLANDRSRGAFDRLKAYRGQKVAQNAQAMKNFSRFSENHAAGRIANTAIGAVANPASMLRGRRGVMARKHALQSAQGQDVMKNSQVWQANQFDDNFLLALADKELAEQKLASARARGDVQEIAAREKGLDAASQIPFYQRNTRATRMAALDSLTKTGYQFSVGKEGYEELEHAVRGIAGDDERARAQLMDSSQYNLRAGGGRFDLGGINHGSGYDYETGIGKGSGYTAGQGKVETYRAGAQHYIGDTVMQVDGSGRATGKTLGTSDEMARAMQAQLESGGLQVDKVAAWHEKLLDARHSAVGANRDEIDKQLEAINRVAAATPSTEGALNTQIALAEAVSRNNSRARIGVDPNLIEGGGGGATGGGEH